MPYKLQIHKGKGQALVEFLTPEDASAAVSFDGRIFCGSILKIRRPKDFVEVVVQMKTLFFLLLLWIFFLFFSGLYSFLPSFLVCLYLISLGISFVELQILLTLQIFGSKTPQKIKCMTRNLLISLFL